MPLREISSADIYIFTGERMPCGCRPGRIKNATRSQTPGAANARRNVDVDRVDPLATTFALRQLAKVGWARLFRFLTLRPDNIYSGRESFAVSPAHLSLSRSASKRVRADLVRSGFARQVFRHRSLLRALVFLSYTAILTPRWRRVRVQPRASGRRCGIDKPGMQILGANTRGNDRRSKVM